VICGAPSSRVHHLTGRGYDGAYLDPELRASLCHDDHELCHEDLRNARVDRPLESATLVERLERGLRRVAMFVARLAEACGQQFLAALAAWLATGAAILAQHVAFLDARYPDWRDAAPSA
jgi:hypothetical protein